MVLSDDKILKRITESVVEENGWVSFNPMENGLGRLFSMDELRAMPLVRVMALIRRVSDYIRIGGYSEGTVFQISYINKSEGWGYSDLKHLKWASRGRGNIPTKSVKKLKRQCQAQFHDKDVKCVSSGKITVNLEDGTVYVNGMCHNPWLSLCDQHVKSITN